MESDVANIRKQGYSGIKKIGVGKTAGNTEWIIFDKNILKDKSELTDIYNKANKPTLPFKPIYETAPKPGKLPTPETSLKPLDTFATNKYGKPASKLTPNQLQTIIRENLQVVPAGKEIVNKIGNVRDALRYDSTRPALTFGGKLNNVYTDGYVFVSDKKMADTINDHIAYQEMKSYMKAYKDAKISDAERLRLSKENVKKQQEIYKTKYPKVEKGGEFYDWHGL